MTTQCSQNIGKKIAHLLHIVLQKAQFLKCFWPSI